MYTVLVDVSECQVLCYQLHLRATADKEQFLPVIEALLTHTGLDVTEAWSFDNVNHGESLALNLPVLEESAEDFCEYPPNL